MTNLTLLFALAGCGDDVTTDSDTDSGTPAPDGCDHAGGCLVGEDLAAGLLSVRAVASDDVWIVGASPSPSDGLGPVILHYDGSDFERLDTTEWLDGELWWAWVTTDEAVFVGYQGLILEMDRADGVLTQVQGIDTGRSTSRSMAPRPRMSGSWGPTARLFTTMGLAWSKSRPTPPSPRS